MMGGNFLMPADLILQAQAWLQDHADTLALIESIGAIKIT